MKVAGSDASNCSASRADRNVLSCSVQISEKTGMCVCAVTQYCNLGSKLGAVTRQGMDDIKKTLAEGCIWGADDI